MTGRERIQAIFRHQPVDRLSWSALVDHHSLQALPTSRRAETPVDFYRQIGCDIVDLSGWGLPWSYSGARLVTPGVEVRQFRDDAGNLVEEQRCPRGVLRQRTSPAWHPIEYPIKTIDDLRLALRRWEASYYEPVDDRAAYAQVDAAIGDDGVSVLFPGPSAIPYLLETQCGVEQFYYLLDDYPDDMAALIRVISERDEQRFALLAQHPCPTAILCENTSTRYISPAIYQRYNLPAQRAFVDAMHQASKTAILHMCGHVRDLLPMIRDTGTDGIHALTPPPLGDTPWELALDILGEKLIILGVLTPDIFHTLPVAEVGPALDRLITPRLAASPFILTLFADGIPVPLERFLAVKDWAESRYTSVGRSRE